MPILRGFKTKFSIIKHLKKIDLTLNNLIVISVLKL